MTSDLSEDLIQSIRSQVNLEVIDDFVYCYKHVTADLTSLYDSNFQYVIGEWVEADNCDLSNKSCAAGLHTSGATYWEGQGGSVVLLCKVKLEDIITIQHGKIRSKRLFVIGKSNSKVF